MTTDLREGAGGGAMGEKSKAATCPSGIPRASTCPWNGRARGMRIDTGITSRLTMSAHQAHLSGSGTEPASTVTRP
ncbi:hypothetical protein [Streptomyces sp. NPDC058084]|uniref:hypothetical protein n=1 Tax=Streptomyces sp. NPDC058084 TaxID=3346333 RepID=UPI0036EB922C